MPTKTKKQIAIPDPFNYYRDQLNRINLKEVFPPKMQLNCLENKTNWISLNKESAIEIVNWLNINFINK